MLAVAGLVGGEGSHVHRDAFTVEPLLAFGYLVAVGSLIGFTAYAWLIRNVRTSVVSTYAYVNPIVAVMLGAVFLNESIGAATLLAGAAIVLSVVLIIRARSAPAPRPVVAEVPSVEQPATLAA
jgi:drug/metabolite transporter (DMT)-like permease